MLVRLMKIHLLVFNGFSTLCLHSPHVPMSFVSLSATFFFRKLKTMHAQRSSWATALQHSLL
jgi:hypothetical protein